MGLGSTTKKIQVLAERAEQMYAQVGELRDQINELRDTVEATGRRVEILDRRSEQQWEILQAIAAEHEIDVDHLLTEAAIEEIDPEALEASEADTESETSDEDSGE